MAPPAKDSDVIDGAKARRPYIILLPPASFSTSTHSTRIQLSISTPLQDKLSRMSAFDTRSISTFGQPRSSPAPSSGTRPDGSPPGSVRTSSTQLSIPPAELEETVVGLQSSVKKIEHKLEGLEKEMKDMEQRLRGEIKDIRAEMKDMEQRLGREMQDMEHRLTALITNSLRPAPVQRPDTMTFLTVHNQPPPSFPYNRRMASAPNSMAWSTSNLLTTSTTNLPTTSTSNLTTASTSNLTTASSANLESPSSDLPLKEKKGRLFKLPRFADKLSERTRKRSKAKDTAPVPPLPAQDSEPVAGPSSPTTARLRLGQPIQPDRH